MIMALHKKYYQLISTLGVILDRDDKEKLNHGLRTAIIAANLAQKLIPEKQTLLFYIGLLHDVGGVGLPHHIVHYALQREETIPRVYQHPDKGAEVISHLPGLKEGTEYVRDHHERWDGSGYPGRKNKADLSTGSQVLLLADQLDLKIRALHDNRTEIYNYFRRQKGKMFNPELWPALLDIIGTSGDAIFDRIVKDRNLSILAKELRAKLPPLQFESTEEDHILQAVRVFGQVIDAKHPYTKGHSRRVALYGHQIGTHLGLNQDMLRDIKIAGYLHDLGKVAIPLDILEKTTDLTNDEYKKVKSHVMMTMELLDYIPFLRHLSPIAGGHHERWDGNGYPDGLKAEEIPLGGRILALADVLDALTSDRSYREADSIDQVAAKLIPEKGQHFDPEIVSLLEDEQVREELNAIRINNS